VRLVDLTLPVQPHWRFQFEAVSQRSGPATATRISLLTHAFTHADAPSHMIPGGAALDQVPLDRFWGEAAVLDLDDTADSEAITAERLARAGHLRRGDVALLRSGLELRHPIGSREFWTRSPYLDRGAAAWLRDAGVKAVGYDFPQDEVIRRLPDPELRLSDFPAHEVLLGAGIVQVEYLVNLHRLREPRVLFFALPLALGALDGSPVRAVALEGEFERA